MSGWTILFLVLCVAAGIFGFGGLLVGAIVGTVKLLFVVFLIIFLVSLLMGNGTRKQNPPSRPMGRR